MEEERASRMVRWLGMMVDQIAALPDDEDQFIADMLAVVDHGAFDAEGYGLG